MKLKRAKIFAIDDESDMLENLEAILKRGGHEVLTEWDSRKALEIVERQRPDLVIVDLVMPDLDGITVLEQIKARYSQIPVIVLTGYATVDSAVEALKKGASDYLSKPFFPEELLHRVEKCLTWMTLDEENRYLREQMQRERQDEEIVGQSRALWEVLQLVDKVAPTDACVLLTGETGSGKELIARTIHRRSLRSNAPFYAVNCSALTENLLESELFGHERGAFTGATETKKGFFEIAHNGTLFLDEISETSLAFQTKLLRVVQDGEFFRVGATRPLKTDVRLISSSNRNLRQAIDRGSFREDLFYRLSVVQIHIPSLRERSEDIPLLAKHFMEKYKKEIRRHVTSISPEAELLLRNYSWPGNIRELRNAIERAMILGNGDMITPEHLPKEIAGNAPVSPEQPPSFHIPENGLSLETVERQLVEQALELASGNQAHAARLLGISRDAFRNRLKKFGML